MDGVTRMKFARFLRFRRPPVKLKLKPRCNSTSVIRVGIFPHLCRFGGLVGVSHLFSISLCANHGKKSHTVPAVTATLSQCVHMVKHYKWQTGRHRLMKIEQSRSATLDPKHSIYVCVCFLLADRWGESFMFLSRGALS